MKPHRDTPTGALVRSLARLVSACAQVVEALAERLRPLPTLPVREQALPRLVAAPSPVPPQEDPLALALRKLGFSPAEVRQGQLAAPSGELPERVQKALAALRRSA